MLGVGRGGRQEHTNHRFTTSQIYPRGTLELCYSWEGTITLIPKWNQNPSSAFVQSPSYVLPAGSPWTPLLIRAFPTTPPPTLTNTLLCLGPCPLSPLPGISHLWSCWTEAPAVQWLGAPVLAPDCLSELVSKICPVTCIKYFVSQCHLL